MSYKDPDSTMISLTDEQKQLIYEMRHFILSRGATTLVARATLASENVEFGIYNVLGSDEPNADVLNWLQKTAVSKTKAKSSGFVAIFPAAIALSEEEFYDAVATQLDKIVKASGGKKVHWQGPIESQNGEPYYRLLYANREFFVFPLHPNAVLRAQRAPYEALYLLLEHQSFGAAE